MHGSAPWKTEETIVGLPRLLVLSVFSRFGGCHLSPPCCFSPQSKIENPKSCVGPSAIRTGSRTRPSDWGSNARFGPVEDRRNNRRLATFTCTLCVPDLVVVTFHLSRFSRFSVTFDLPTRLARARELTGDKPPRHIALHPPTSRDEVASQATWIDSPATLAPSLVQNWLSAMPQDLLWMLARFYLQRQSVKLKLARLSLKRKQFSGRLLRRINYDCSLFSTGSSKNGRERQT